MTKQLKSLDNILDHLQAESIRTLDTKESVWTKYLPSRNKAKQEIISLFVNLVESCNKFGTTHHWSVMLNELEKKVKQL